MSKLNLKWIIISLILIAPYIELARLLIDNYHQFRDFKWPGLFPTSGSTKLYASDLYVVLFNLKYYFILYGTGLVVGFRYHILRFETENLIYSMVYLVAFLALLMIIFALAAEGMEHLFQLHPFIVISSFLIILSLAATRRKIVG